MKSTIANRTSRLKLRSAVQLLLAVVAVCGLFAGGCAMSPKTLAIADREVGLPENTIFEAAAATVISQAQLIDQLAGVQVVYVGESHTNPSHHAIQLAVIQNIFATTSDVTIGMEMFDHTYQPVLDRWVAGELDETSFLQQTHWYANWRYDYGLYRDILEYAKEKKLRVIALNVPTYISSRIRVGGIASLSADDRRHLPATIDTTDADHRAYLEEIFSMHRFSGKSSFDFFYEAQCTWEDAMADRVARNLGAGKMVVLAGNGHIIRGFGIPNRAFTRNGAPFKTIYLAAVGGEAETAWADYLWVTPDQRMPRHSMRAGAMKSQ